MSWRWLLVLLLCGTGCSRRFQDRTYAAEVRAAHEQADTAHDPRQKAAAKAALDGAFQRGGGSGVEIALRQDLADRTARLELDLGHPREALRWARRGLAIDGAPSILRANLLITEADALVAQGQRHEARQALLSALEINQALLRLELNEVETR
jgi:hypothetical protein